MRFLVVALLLLLPSPGAAAAVPPPDPSRFAAELRAFAAADSIVPPPLDAIVFYGSSSIRMWHPRLAADFPRMSVVGRGFGGSTMSEAAFWVDRVVAPLEPRLVVLYEGDNDIEMGRTPDQVIRDFDLLVAKLHASDSRLPILVLSIKPSGARWAKWPLMQATNARLRAICERKWSGMQYVDVGTPLLGADGKPREELFLPDHLHLSPLGYDAWRAVVAPAIVAILEEFPRSISRTRQTLPANRPTTRSKP